MGAQSIPPGNLRKIAEDKLAGYSLPAKALVLSDEELLHEFQVHQIELEMQNEELRKSHLALEESRDRYLDLYEFAPICYATIGRNGMIGEINLTGCDLLGVKRAKLINRRFSRFVALQDRDRWHRLFLNMMEREDFERQAFDLEMVRDDGTAFYVLFDCRRRGEADSQAVLRVALVDITELKLAEAKSRSDEEQLRSLFENAPTGMVAIDPDNGRILRANHIACEMWGYAADEFLTKTATDITYPDDLAESLLRNEQLACGRINKQRFEKRYLRKDGSHFWGETCVSTLKDAGGKTSLFIGNTIDITKRRNTESEFLKFFSLTPDLVCIASTSGYFLRINARWKEKLGYPEHEMLSTPFLDFVHPEDRIATVKEMEQLKSENQTFHFTNRYRCKDGSYVYLEWSATPDVERNQLFAIARDISERMKIDALLLENSKLLDEAQMIAGLGTYVVDIRTGQWESSDILDRIFGIGETYGRSVEGWEMLIHPDDRKMMSEYFRNDVLGKGVSFDKEYRITRHDDRTVRWVHGLGKLEFDSRGCPVKMLGTIQDITEKKKIEAELRIASVTFKSHEGMTITDKDMMILKVNPTFTRITGYTEEEVIGKNPRILGSGRQDASFYHSMWESINSNGAWEGRIWDRRKNGEIYPAHLTISAVKDNSGSVINYVGVFTDSTDSQAAEDEIKQLAFYDFLTGLPNRRLLVDRLMQSMASSMRTGKEGALLFIDLDNFKIINDTMGHAMGDMLLQQVAERLKSCVRVGDTVARMGGDEFVVMLDDLSEQSLEAAAQAEVIGQKVLATLNQPYRLGRKEFYNSPSIGIALFNNNQRGFDELFKQADIAMYQAKQAGRNTLRFFDPQMQEAISVRAAIEDELHNALENHQFYLHYQIQVDHLQRPFGAEALIRWMHPERGLVSPAEFIPIAEETGLILPIGKWVLETACAQLSAWQRNVQTRELILSVNVSAKQFRQADFVAQVQAVIQRYAIHPARLKLELTESILLDNMQSIIATMKAINALGVRFSLDDFGTGYSSLQYLKQLPLHQLKIDQSFVRDLAVDSSDKAIVNTIIAMAHSLNLEVIAEGVETEGQRQYLEIAGCTHYQGYLFGKPMPIKQFTGLLEQG